MNIIGFSYAFRYHLSDSLGILKYFPTLSHLTSMCGSLIFGRLIVNLNALLIRLTTVRTALSARLNGEVIAL